MPFFTSRNDKAPENPTDSNPPQQQHRASTFASLHPPVTSNQNYTKPQQGIGIGRDSKTPILSADDLSSKEKTKFFTDCKQEYLASINCRLEHHDHKESNICQPLFDSYKACRKEEHQRLLEENAGKSFW